MLFSYISPVSIALSYALRFALLDNVQIIPPGLFYPLTGGVLHFDLIRPLPIPGYAFHSHILPKIQFTETYHFITSLLRSSHHPKIVQNPHTIQ